MHFHVGSDHTMVDQQSLSTEEVNEPSISRRQFARGTVAGGLVLGGVGASSTSALASHLDISLGENVTFEEMNREDRGAVVDEDIVLQEGGSTTYLGSNRAVAVVEGESGVGNATFWADIGRKFIPRGDEPQEARLSTIGRVTGVLDGIDILDTTVQGKIGFRINDFTARSVERSTAFWVGREDLAQEERFDEQFRGELETTLEPDHSYIAWIRMVARLDSEVDVVDARSDWGANQGGAQVGDITIQF